MQTTATTQSVALTGAMNSGFEQILTDDALAFLAQLHRRFNTRRLRLLHLRQEQQKRFDAGALPDFSPETANIRNGEWVVAPVPEDLIDRRVEITGPTDRKTVINALNSGARVFMADFEDAACPSWENMVTGQINLRDAVNRSIDYTSPQGRHYELHDKVAVLMVRPRGLHLSEKHVLIDQEPASASLFDFGLYFFHNVHELREMGTAPYFYLPKLESHHEARLWNEIFIFAQQYMGLPTGLIKATALIETLPAAFEMNEILFELREHSAGLTCGRWGYMASYIKTLRNHAGSVLPERGQLNMLLPFLKEYADLMIKTSHRRGVHAIGGMAAEIPVKNDEAANSDAMEKIVFDKKREAVYGHDGTWVAHPGLVEVALEQYHKYMPMPNQIYKKRDDVNATAQSLLALPEGNITLAGLENNINVAIQYLEAWLGGVGCITVHHLMEDAATAEICRAQVWHWVRHEAKLSDGTAITAALVQQLIPAQLEKIKQQVGAGDYAQGHYGQAAQLFEKFALHSSLDETMTAEMYG